MSQLRTLYEQEKLSIPQIADRLGLPRSRVRSKLIEQGVPLRSRAEGVWLRRDAIGDAHRGKKREFTPDWKSAIALARTRHGEQFAKGVTLKASGYLEYTRGQHKGRLVHVVTMEERLGRRLLPDEVVHHIDGDRSNNSIDNLAVMTRAAHTRLHRREDKLAGNERKRENGRFC